MKSCPPPASITYDHPIDYENFKNGFEDGSLDAEEGIFSLCAAKKCDMRNPYERGYKLGYKKEVRAQKKKGLIDPLIDSPGKTIGSDFNGDGIHDFIVGAYNAASGAGAAYIFFGASTLSGTKDLATVSADVVFFGKTGSSYFGNNVSSAGDVNGDGIDDILVGARGEDPKGRSSAGEAYIFFGATDLSGTKNLATTASADVTILGKVASDLLGPVSGAGDVNGDGFDDVIVGASGNDDGASAGGAAYILFGAGNLSGTKDLLLSSTSVDITILGKSDGGNEALGGSVSGAGDVNGDGFDDIIVGEPVGERIHIVFGASTLSGTKNLSGADSADVTILGKTNGDLLGENVSSVGDVNVDGFTDFIVGAQWDDITGRANAGAAYVFFGATDLSGTKSLGAGQSADITILGKAANDRVGKGVGGGRDSSGR